MKTNNKTINDRWFWALNFWVPLTIGSLIYLFYRPTTLLVFKWLNFTPVLKNYIIYLRPMVFIPLNDFIIYSIPTGLWSYSAQVTILKVWEKDHNNYKLLWILIFIVMIYFSELGQLIGLIRGTFDIKDLCVLLLSTCLAIFFTSEKKNEKKAPSKFFST